MLFAAIDLLIMSAAVIVNHAFSAEEFNVEPNKGSFTVNCVIQLNSVSLQIYENVNQLNDRTQWPLWRNEFKDPDRTFFKFGLLVLLPITSMEWTLRVGLIGKDTFPGKKKDGPCYVWGEKEKNTRRKDSQRTWKEIKITTKYLLGY